MKVVFFPYLIKKVTEDFHYIGYVLTIKNSNIHNNIYFKDWTKTTFIASYAGHYCFQAQALTSDLIFNKSFIKYTFCSICVVK